MGDYYPDPNEPYRLEESEYGTCPDCGSGLENWGACSDGDGDLYDDIGCPMCQESKYRSDARIWFDDNDDESGFVDDDDFGPCWDGPGVEWDNDPLDYEDEEE